MSTLHLLEIDHLLLLALYSSELQLLRLPFAHRAGVDLTHIARTSYGIAQSPPSGNTFGTSPTKTKSFDVSRLIHVLPYCPGSWH
jgi:hypothetical protein